MDSESVVHICEVYLVKELQNTTWKYGHLHELAHFKATPLPLLPSPNPSQYNLIPLKWERPGNKANAPSSLQAP